MIKERQLEIDWLKGLAIIFVLLMHSLDSSVLYGIRQELYLGQAVPVFFMVTFYLAFKKCASTENYFRDWYSKRNFTRLFKRIIFPFLLIWGLQLIGALIYGVIQRDNLLVYNVLIGGGVAQVPIIHGNIFKYGFCVQYCIMY